MGSQFHSYGIVWLKYGSYCRVCHDELIALNIVPRNLIDEIFTWVHRMLVGSKLIIINVSKQYPEYLSRYSERWID